MRITITYIFQVHEHFLPSTSHVSKVVEGQPVHHHADIEPKTEVVETPVIAGPECRSHKHRGKQPSTLYECDCGEVILRDDLKQGDGVIECNKAGCETRWVSIHQISTARHELLTAINSFTYDVFGLTSRFRIGSVSLVWLQIITGNEQSDEI